MTDSKNILLGVNIDHVATLRQARGVSYPEPLVAARIAMQSGGDSITVHLREDRRHIQDHDVIAIRQLENTPLNLEMAATREMVTFALKVKPDYCCIVPEKREELTTEGGLDVVAAAEQITLACAQLQDAGIRVSLFIDADENQIRAAGEAGAGMIELHTGHYANAVAEDAITTELQRLQSGARLGKELGLQVNAGHGLHYENVASIAAIPEIVELNIGHSIIARAIMTGLHEAVASMKQRMLDARP